ncbi:MAG: hypothetical protein FWG73_06630 [Planctomycetaceae bacterium]|nr:hypothetical protein [Planctomycetaceae bacterium]
MGKSNSTMGEILSIAGTLGLDVADVRTLLPDVAELADQEIETHLQHGQTLHRLNIASRLYNIIESPDTIPRDLIAANKYLKEVHAKVSAETGSQELLVLLRETIPSAPADGRTYIEEDYDEEEDDEG